MRFRMLSNSSRTPSDGRDIGYLWTDNWNDWYKYQTLYVLTYFDAEGGRHEIGSVKIGQFGMAKDQGRPELPPEFASFDDRFFSLGQDASYYSAISQLQEDVPNRLLSSLKDLVADRELF